MSMMNGFELDGRATSNACVPTATQPKSVANCIGPGGLETLMYNRTADPMKRNTAKIAVGYSKFSTYVGVSTRNELPPLRDILR